MFQETAVEQRNENDMKWLMWMALVLVGLATVLGCGGAARVASKAGRAGRGAAKVMPINPKVIPTGAGLLDDASRVKPKGRLPKEGNPQRGKSWFNNLPLDRIHDLNRFRDNRSEKPKTPRFTPRRP